MNSRCTISPNSFARLASAKGSVSILAVAAMIVSSAPAIAAIDNTATANGTPSRGTYTPATDSESVNVAPAAPALTVSKSVATATTAAGPSAPVRTAPRWTLSRQLHALQVRMRESVEQHGRLDPLRAAVRYSDTLDRVNR